MHLRLLIGPIRFAVLFLLRHGREISTRIFLPILLGGGVSYVCLDLFFFELQLYLSSPSDRLASLILGIAAAGLLLGAFIFSVAATAVVSLALGREPGGWRYFSVSRSVWRVYAALLRALLLYAGLVTIYAALVVTSGYFPFSLLIASNIVLVGGGALLVVRCCFLATPIACATDEGPILRAAWALSYQAFWQISVMIAMALVLGYTTELVGESVVMLGGGMHISAGEPLGALVRFYRSILAPLVIVQAISSAVMMISLLPVSVGLYRELISL